MKIYKSPAGERAVAERYRELLDRWPVPNEQLRVPTREGETFVVASGPADAPPVLLLHGSTANTVMWSQDVAAWSTSFRVYAVDMIGEPGLSAPARPPLASEAYARWLDDVLTGLGLTTVALVGVSLGGWLAMDFATRCPDRVDRVVLLNPSGIGRQRFGFLFKAMLLSLLGERGLRRTLEIAAAPIPPEALRGTEIADLTVLIARHFRPRMGKIPVFSDDALLALPMPVLVIVGAHDTLLDATDTARRAATIPHATVRVLPDAGHIIWGQTDEIDEFLRVRS